MSETAKAVRAKIEAALYSSGRALDAEQLANAAGITSKKRATEEAKAIAASLKSALSAVEIVEYPGPRFAMQLKADYTSVARRFATKPLLSKAALRTLSFISLLPADIGLRPCREEELGRSTSMSGTWRR